MTYNVFGGTLNLALSMLYLKTPRFILFPHSPWIRACYLGDLRLWGDRSRLLSAGTLAVVHESAKLKTGRIVYNQIQCRPIRNPQLDCVNLCIGASRAGVRGEVPAGFRNQMVPGVADMLTRE